MDEINNQITDQISSQVSDYLQNTTSDVTVEVTNFIFQWVAVPAMIFMALILVIYIVRTIRRYRVEKAIFEIRDALVHKEQKKPAELEVTE